MYQCKLGKSKLSIFWWSKYHDFCREHNEHYIRWVRFKAGEIPCLELGCVEGSFLNPQQEPGVQEHESLQRAIAREDPGVRGHELITHEPTDCCDWAMDTMSFTGIGNQHEERCVCPFVPKRLIICHHEGCTKKVHRRCQEDWLERHCYKWTPEDPSFC